MLMATRPLPVPPPPPPMPLPTAAASEQRVHAYIVQHTLHTLQSALLLGGRNILSCCQARPPCTGRLAGHISLAGRPPDCTHSLPLTGYLSRCIPTYIAPMPLHLPIHTCVYVYLQPWAGGCLGTYTGAPSTSLHGGIEAARCSRTLTSTGGKRCSVLRIT